MSCLQRVARWWVGLGLAALPAQDFVPDRTPVPPPRPVLTLSAEVRLVLTAGELQVVTAHDKRRVGCTAVAGPGRVHVIAQSPDGTVFVGAENGLFVLAAEQPVLDPMDLFDGVPAGVPRGLLVDADHRLWLCTDTEFGVVDTRFGFGRTFGAGDGLPAPPFVRLASGEDGSILLAARDGGFRYRPDVGPPPAASGELPGALVAAGSDGEGRLPDAITVAARGGATLRQRRQYDLELRAMDGLVLRDVPPGRHLVEVHAFDRDLRRTRIGICEVEVPPPHAARWLALGAAGAGVLLWLWAWRQPRPGATARARVAAATGAAALVFVAGMQLPVASLDGARCWPFAGLPIRTETWHANSVVHRPQLIGVAADGSRVTGDALDVGMVADRRRQPLAELVFGDATQRRDLLERWNARRPAALPPLVAFRLSERRIRLTAHGPVDVAPTVWVDHAAP